LSAIDILDGLRVAGTTPPWLDEPSDDRRFADGGLIRASLGEALWRGSVELDEAPHAVARAAEVRIEAAARAGRTILIGDARIAGPAADPWGTILGSATPVLDTVNPLRIRISGLPAQYRLSAGDFLAFDYGSPARRALHRVETETTANWSGITPLFHVLPAPRAGTVAGAAVTLLRPQCRAVILAWRQGRARRDRTSGAGFDWVQVLR